MIPKFRVTPVGALTHENALKDYDLMTQIKAPGSCPHDQAAGAARNLGRTSMPPNRRA